MCNFLEAEVEPIAKLPPLLKYDVSPESALNAILVVEDSSYSLSIPASVSCWWIKARYEPLLALTAIPSSLPVAFTVKVFTGEVSFIPTLPSDWILMCSAGVPDADV